MSAPSDTPEQSWAFVASEHFNEFDELAQAIGGWGVDFRQLGPGRSPGDLVQFGSPDFLVTRFHVSESCDQRGSTPPGMLTLGFRESRSGMVFTPEGTVTDDAIWCFSAGREFACTSQSDFRACGLSLSESILDEVAETCGLWDVRATLGSNQILRCHQRADVDEIHDRLLTISNLISSNSRALRSPKRVHDLEHDLTRQILEILAGPLDVIRPDMTSRRQLVLKRTLEYLEANPTSPITVYELAKEVGAGVRTLEYVFQDYFGVTPKAYLTTQRLIGTRRELKRSDAQSRHVGNIALKWGFCHFGRFSKTYQQFFGELPSKTACK
jgi:AraC-like DNA-binding protein